MSTETQEQVEERLRLARENASPLGNGTPVTQAEREEGELLSSTFAPEVDPPAVRNRPLSDAAVTRRFTYHRPSARRALDHELVRQEFRSAAFYLNGILPAGREASLAFTALEEASFWAQAAIAREGK